METIKFSPRERGCSRRSAVHLPKRKVFPARAGMFRLAVCPRAGVPCFPRASGDVPTVAVLILLGYAFSPRERGCSQLLPAEMLSSCVFPARAGMFPTRGTDWIGQISFPRASGDVPVIEHSAVGIARFSPRERGCSRNLS